MADIYLAISETPTVVTLTNAVINSAVASSVTVTNTVTVALDANSLSALENVTVTVGAAITGTVTVGNSVTIGSLPLIAGTVTANVPLSVDGYTGTTGVRVIGTGVANSLRIQGISPVYNIAANLEEGGAIPIFSFDNNPLPISGTVTVGNTVTIAGTVTANPTGTQTIAGSVTIGAGTAQIGSVTASISGTVPVSGTFFQTTQPVSLATLPALAAGTAQIGSVTASISNSVTIASLPAISGTVTANISISSTAITSGSFTSLTSATLVPANTARKMATVFNQGAGQLFVNAGATATTLGGGFMVALSSGDFYECDYTTTTLSAIFATAGTASWVSH